MKYNKKFLILGNLNAVVYSNVFPYLKSGEITLGYNCGNMSFISPYHKNLCKFGNTCWFTNLTVCKTIINYSFLKYNPLFYPKYDNYDAIEVSKLSTLPMDYYGVMGVPKTFMLNYNPAVFKILCRSTDVGGLYINGKQTFERILIQKII